MKKTMSENKLTQFQLENDALLESLFERTFYRGWRGDEGFENWRGIELIPNYNCNLSCKYCYVNRYTEELYPSCLWDEEEILKNLEITLNWLRENNFDPKLEIFSGELLAQDIGYKILEKTLEIMEGTKNAIVIPTNYTFMLNDKLTKRVEALLEKSLEIGKPIRLSTSIDGKYCEINRPLASSVDKMITKSGRIIDWEYKEGAEYTDPRDDTYYDKVFVFNKKWNMGYHPMVYSHNIDKWEKNFLWFQEMFKKHDIPWYNIYLLEVRNAEWNKEQVIEFGKFIKFLINFTFDKCDRDAEKYINFLFEKRGFNMLASPFTKVGRGLGCSLQSALYLRLGNLSFSPCHRQSYEHMITGKLRVENDKIVGIEAINPEMYIAELTCDFKAFPYCEACELKTVCSGGCLGAQLETTGDSFTPIPSMCAMEFEKIRAMIEAYKELNIWDDIYIRVMDYKKPALLAVEKAMESK